MSWTGCFPAGIVLCLLRVLCNVGFREADGAPQPQLRFLRKLAGLDRLGRKDAAGFAPRSQCPAKQCPPSRDGRIPDKLAGTDRVLHPADFFADPTGVHDSSDAFDALLAHAWTLTPARVAEKFTNGPDLSAVIDLGAGIYTLSRPLYFPAAGGGGLLIRDGTIRAHRDFPEDPPGAASQLALLMLTQANGTKEHEGMCCWYEYIYFSNLILDGGLRTGCVRAQTATHIVFDEIFFTGFATTGLYYGGNTHQLMLSRSYFGTTDWRGGGDRSLCEEWSHARQNVGLHLDGPDNHVEDCVFFCAGIGLKVTSTSNYFQGIHAFTGAAEHYPLGGLYVPATPGHRGSERPDGQHGNRFEHCYWDYAAVRIENPSQIAFSDNYVIGLPSREDPAAYFMLTAVGSDVGIDGLRVTGCIFRSAGAEKYGADLTAFAVNETSGTFARDKVRNTVVAGNSFHRVRGAATQLRRSLTQHEPSREWTFDFCGVVLLGARREEELFHHMQYSLRVTRPPNGFATSAISGVDGCVVTVATDVAVRGTVYLEVDQSQDDFGAAAS